MPKHNESFTVARRPDYDYEAAFNMFIKELDNQGFKNLDVQYGKSLTIKETRPPFQGDWPVTIKTDMILGEDSVVLTMFSSNFGIGPIQKRHCVKIHTWTRNRLLRYFPETGECPSLVEEEIQAAIAAAAAQDALDEYEEYEALPEEIEETEE